MESRRELNRIIVAEDLREGDAASKRRGRWVREYCTWLADRLKAPLELVHVEADPDEALSMEPYSDFSRERLALAKRRLLRLARENDARTQAQFLIGDPADKLLEYVRGSGRRASVLATGTRGRTGLQHLILGSVAEELVRGASIPVLVLGPKSQGNSRAIPSGGTPLLVVATDLTAHGRSEDRFAVALARRLKAKVRLVHSFNPSLPTVIYPEAPGSTDVFIAMHKQAQEETRTLLRERVREYRRHGVEVALGYDERGGDPAGFILAQAKGAQLLVLGRHSKGRLTRAFFGNTARRVFLQSPIPVISVP